MALGLCNKRITRRNLLSFYYCKARASIFFHRIFEVESWREKQRYTRECVRDETRLLREEKQATELYLESLQVPLAVISQCLSNRDQRVAPELTRDQLGEELKRVRSLDYSP